MLSNSYLLNVCAIESFWGKQGTMDSTLGWNWAHDNLPLWQGETEKEILLCGNLGEHF